MDRWSAIVPTLGLSPHLRACLEALRDNGGEALHLVVVAPKSTDLGGAEELADQVIWTEGNLGFAAANNVGIAAAIAATGSDWLALVNDDVMVAKTWSEPLFALLRAYPGVAAVQGINCDLANPELIDGCGIGWNDWWQAVQLGKSQPVAPWLQLTAPVELFGVSATAAIYRRQAVEAVSQPAGKVFDERLFAYYEDVELACRLRAAGSQCLLEPKAVARHAGSASGRTLRLAGSQLIHGNRWLVLARLFGRRFPRIVPKALFRDLLDSLRALSRGQWARALGVAVGGLRALRHLPFFLHLGAPAVRPGDLHRLANPGPSQQKPPDD